MANSRDAILILEPGWIQTGAMSYLGCLANVLATNYVIAFVSLIPGDQGVYARGALQELDMTFSKDEVFIPWRYVASIVWDANLDQAKEKFGFGAAG
jgi:hypothetical protein